MNLKGEFGYAFGNFPCLRGFATLGELADNSIADESYQRTLDDAHLKRIQEFLANIEYTFFPEIILGISLERLMLDYDAQHEFRELLDDPTGRPSKKMSPMLTVQLGRKMAKQSVRELTLVLSSKQPCISRIDGNHRLEAVPDPQSDIRKIRQRIAPFCLVIFETEERYDFFAPLFFHGINYRSLSIPKEKNLEIILRKRKRDGEYIFGDLELQKDSVFGMPYYYARKADEVLSLKAVPCVAEVLHEEFLVFLLDYFELVFRRREFADDVRKACEKIRRALILIDSELESFSSLDKISSKLLIPMTYYIAHGRKQDFETFVSWIKLNSLIQLSNANPEDVMTIFEHTHRRGPYKVFVAMPYVSHKRVNDFNKLFREVLDDLNRNGTDGVRFELIPIMRFRGAAQRIDQRLIKCIKECDVFIADITGNNDNVIFEVGLAEGANKPIFLIRQDNDDKAEKVFIKNDEYIKDCGHVPFDMDKLQYIPYSATGYYNDIKGIVKRHLPIIVKELND